MSYSISMDISPSKAYTAEDIKALDQYTMHTLGVDEKQLMEIAGLQSAEMAARMVPSKGRIAILYGPGGNGGDALVAAKWLALWEYTPILTPSHDPDRFRSIVHHQRAIAEALSLKETSEPEEDVCAVIDGLIGSSLSGDPRGYTAELIDWANDLPVPVLSLDIPSGLDATTGDPHTPCIRAQETIVFGLMKKGLLTQTGKAYAGKITLVDIGLPRALPTEQP